MDEIPIDDVIFENFATLLSLVQDYPFKVTEENAEKLLQLADRFLLPAAKRHLELFIATTSKGRTEKLRIADKYQLDVLLKHSISLFNDFRDFQTKCQHCVVPAEKFSLYTDKTNARLFEKALGVVFKRTASVKLSEASASIYDEIFAKTDKTDAILVVQGKKMHVNKAVLSYHSDYFNTVFNSNFKENSMAEIPINDVKFEDFAALLSHIQRYPIIPTEFNAEKLLELADRFKLPSVKRHLELFLMSSAKTAMEKIRIGDKFRLKDLVVEGCSKFTNLDNFNGLLDFPEFKNFSDNTKTQLFHKFVCVQWYNNY